MVYLKELDLPELAEGVDLEAKKAAGKDGRGTLPKSFFETYSAMANTYGGTILLGVEEKPKGHFKLIGIEDVDQLRKAIWDNLNNRKQVNANLLADKMVVVSEFYEKKMICVNVPRARRNQKPIYVGANPLEGTFRRNYEGDYRCDEDTVRRMMADRIEDSRDSHMVDGFDINDIEANTLDIYRNQFRATKFDHPWLSLNDRDFLRSIGAWTRDRESSKEGLTLAGLLMFGKLRSILEAVPHFVLDYQERQDNGNDTRWVDRVTLDGTWSGNLFDFYRIIINKLYRDLKIPFRLENMKRIDETRVHEAIREALVNTLIHADYTGHVPTLVVKIPDMLMFRNPGMMRLPMEDVLRGGISDCRNRNLQKMFQLIGLGEQAGSGIPKIFRNWGEQFWRAPELSEELDPDRTQLAMRMVSLLPKGTLEELDQRFGHGFRKLSELQKLALSTVAIEGKVTHSRLKSMSSAHRHDITLALSALVKEGYLESSGVSKGTFYFFPGEFPRYDRSFIPNLFQTKIDQFN